MSAVRFDEAAFAERVNLRRLEHAAIFRKAGEVAIRFQQLFRLDMTIVECVDEIERDVARNQIETRSPADSFPGFITVLQKILLSSLF